MNQKQFNMINVNINYCQNYFIWILCAWIYFLEFSRIFLSSFAIFYLLIVFSVFSKIENLIKISEKRSG